MGIEFKQRQQSRKKEESNFGKKFPDSYKNHTSINVYLLFTSNCEPEVCLFLQSTGKDGRSTIQEPEINKQKTQTHPYLLEKVPGLQNKRMSACHSSISNVIIVSRIRGIIIRSAILNDPSQSAIQELSWSKLS